MLDEIKTAPFALKVAPAVMRWGPWALLALALVSYGVFAIVHAPTRGLWFDEYASLYFADPRAPLSTLLADTHPPLYYLLVRLGEGLGLSEQGALWAVNLTATLAFCALAYVLLARAGRARFALVALAAVLASPAALTFALEGRNYAMAEFACLALTAAALARQGAPWSRIDVALALLGALCAGAHLYAALYAGALGVGLALVALWRKQQDDLVRGLIIGASASTVAAAWLAIAAPVLFSGQSLVGWIPNSVGYSVGQFWFFNKMLSGAGPNALLLAAAIGLCLWLKPSRADAVLLTVTGAVFLALPTLVSLVKPMLAGRYLTIAAPSLLLLALNAAWRALITPTPAAPPRRAAAFALVALFALVAAAFAHPVAARLTAENRFPWFSGQARAALADCRDPRVRVWTPKSEKVGAVDQQALYLAAYRRALAHANIALDPSTGPARDVADAPCKLIAWGEHVTVLDMPTADEPMILGKLGLTNKTGAPLIIEKHSIGFLVLRAD